MTQKTFDPNALAEILDIGGAEMRGPFLAQLVQDITRCHAVFKSTLADGVQIPADMALKKYAHEVKGLALTIGGTDLADLAQKLENACTAQQGSAIATLLPQVERLTEQTINALADLAQAT